MAISILTDFDSLGISPGMVWFCHIKVLHLIFQAAFILVSLVAKLIYITTSCEYGYSFPNISSPAIGFAYFIHDSYFDQSEIKHQYIFLLKHSWLLSMLNTFSRVFWPFVFLNLNSIYSFTFTLHFLDFF